MPGGDEDPRGHEASESYEAPSHVICRTPQDGAVRRLSVRDHENTTVSLLLCVIAILTDVHGMKTDNENLYHRVYIRDQLPIGIDNDLTNAAYTTLITLKIHKPINYKTRH